MQPRLCDFSTVLSTYSGAGVRGLFTKVISNTIKHNLNGTYTLDMEISTSDPMALIAQIGMTVFAKPDDHTSPQIFVIKRITVENDSFIIYGEHIKELFFSNMILADPYSTPVVKSGTPSSVVNDILQNELVLPNYFTFTSSLQNTVNVDVGTEQKTLGDIFTNSKDGIMAQIANNGGQGGGVADLVYNNFNLSIVSYAGSSEPLYSVRYGVNLKSFSVDEGFESAYTHILPYADVKTLDSYSGDVDTVRIYKDVGNPLQSTNGVFPQDYVNILPVDFSEKFKNKHGYVDPSNGVGYSAVRNIIAGLSNDYVLNNPQLAKEAVSVKVEYESELATFQKPHLGDHVWVMYEPLGYQAVHRISEICYDCVEEKVTSLTIGEGKKPYSLYDFIKQMR